MLLVHSRFPFHFFLFIFFLGNPRLVASRRNVLVCNNQFPSLNQIGSIPLDQLLLNYKTVNQLCKWEPAAARKRGMGCLCVPGDHTHNCIKGLADPVLWEQESLFHFCYGSCRCPFGNLFDSDMDGGSEDIENDAESIASSDPLDGLEGSYRTLDSGDEKSSMDQSYGSVSDLSADMTDNLARQEHRFDPTISAFLSGPQKCGTQCTNFRCADRGRGCKCLAAPNKAQRGTWQMYGCAMAIASGRGRRSVDSGVPNGDWACPCNASYVSHSCCDADGGVVWEDPLNKLGVLA